MPFGGGNQGSLVNHEHNPLVPLDGGALATNATSFGLSAGSTLYSDGTDVQELAIGNASDVMTVSGGVPAWVAPAGPGATPGWEPWEEFNGSTTSSLLATFATPYVLADFEALRVDFLGTLGTPTAYRVHCEYDTGLTGSHYYNQGMRVEAGTVNGINDSNQGAVCPSGQMSVNNLASGATVQGSFYFYENPSKTDRNIGFYNFGSNGDVFCNGAHWFEGTYTQISSFKLVTQANSWNAATQIRTFRMNKP
jgi:hypothetical protein